jgi:pilus assembly protein CpaE
MRATPGNKPMNQSAAETADGAQVKVNMGGAPAAVEAYRHSPTPNMIVVEFSNDRNALLEQLDQLSESCDSGTKVVVAGRVNDIILYRELMARGVSEYLVAPFTVVDFIRSVSNLYHAPGASAVGRVIAVMGAKGGSGSSIIAHNLAWSIARSLESATVLADMSLAFGTAGLDFNQDPPQGIAEAVYAPDRLDANLVDRLLSKCTDNLSLLAASASLDKNYDFEATAFDNLIDILRSTTPNIVLDLPHLWVGWTRRMLIGADEIVLVASPDLASLRNTKNILDSMRVARVNDAKPKLVMNNVGLQKRPEIAVLDFAKAVEIEPIAVIPHDAKLFGTAANNGQMIAEVEGNHKTAEAFNDMARLVTGRQAAAPKAKRNLLEPLLSRFARKKA